MNSRTIGMSIEWFPFPTFSEVQMGSNTIKQSYIKNSEFQEMETNLENMRSPVEVNGGGFFLPWKEVHLEYRSLS
jgi:hypothetical protein